MSKVDQVSEGLEDLVDLAKVQKPNDQSERDQYYAIFITELEKALAFYEYYCRLQGGVKE